MDLLQQFPQAAAFTIQGRDEAVLMIHGFTSTAQVFSDLAKYLHQKLGWEIRVPLLPGHGKTYDQLNGIRGGEWIDFAEKEFMQLASRYSKIHLIGLSMGGTLCAHLATRYPENISSLTLLAPALYLRGSLQRFLLSITRLLPKFFLRDSLVHKPVDSSLEKISYHVFSLKSVIAFDEVCRFVKREFHSRAPTLVIYTKKDQTIDPKSSFWFFERVQTKSKKMVVLESSPHVLFLGNENDRIFAEIAQFLKSQA